MIQSLINLLYRYPRAELKRVKKFGGYAGYLYMLYSSKLMKKAAPYLPPVNSYSDGLPVYFLTGERFLYQTLFCIQSLSKHSTEKFRYMLVDDGSLTDLHIQQINKQLPGAEIFTKAIIEQNIEKTFPQNSFPVLRHKRKVYPHIKKLTDIHTLPGNAWKLVLDSDMLFWNNPAAMIAWLKNPEKPMYMVDCTESYGYSQQLMEQLAGAAIPPLLNVGIIGLNSETINWETLENWVKVLEQKENATYFLEQALSAMLVAGNKSVVLTANDYIVNPDNENILNSTGTLQHYVDQSKKGYYTIAWRKYIA